jgi:hypothetical protein
MDYKILERNGKFLVGRMIQKKRFFWSKPIEEFDCIWSGLNRPAHFETLEEAKEFVKIITKPDQYHDI